MVSGCSARTSSKRRFSKRHRKADGHYHNSPAESRRAFLPSNRPLPPAPASSSATMSSKSSAMFIPCVVAGIPYIASTVASLIPLEVGERSRTAFRHWSSVAIPWIVAIVDVPVKTAWPMEPRSGAEEHPVNKPVRPIVAIRSAIIRCIVKVPVRAHRWHSDSNTNADLCGCYGTGAE